MKGKCEQVTCRKRTSKLTTFRLPESKVSVQLCQNCHAAVVSHPEEYETSQTGLILKPMPPVRFHNTNLSSSPETGVKSPLPVSNTDVSPTSRRAKLSNRAMHVVFAIDNLLRH